MSAIKAGDIRHIEHLKIQTTAFKVVDKTMIWDNRPQWSHDHEVWVDLGSGGRWMFPEEAEEFARALMEVVSSHRTRHARNIFEVEEVVAHVD